MTGRANMQAKIFISYSRRQKEFVRELFTALVEQGFDPWIDFDDIPFSVDWWEEIKEAIERFDVFLFVVSNDSLLSRVANKELTYARELNKRIIPVIAEKVDIKQVVGELFGEAYEMDARDNYQYIRTLNWIYFHRPDDDFETGVQNIISATQVDRTHLREHTRILNRAQEWVDNGRGEGFLLQGEDLADAERWLARAEGRTPMPISLQVQYIETSRQVEDEREERYESMRRQTALLRRASAGLIVTAIVVMSGVLFLLWQSRGQLAANEARVAEIQTAGTAFVDERRMTQASVNQEGTQNASAQQTVVADTILQRQRADSLRLALESETAIRNGDPNLLAIPLALQAHRVVQDGDAPARTGLVLADVAYRPGLMRFLSLPGQPTAHEEGISGLVYSPQQGYIASGGLDGAVRVWDTQTGDLLMTLENADMQITALALSAQGELASGNSSGQIVRWNMETGEQIDTLPGHGERVTALAYSPDGDRLVSGGADTNLFLWDTTTGERLLAMNDHAVSVTAVAYRPDGARFVSGDAEGRLLSWNTRDRFFVRNERRHSGRLITDIAYSPEGALLSASQNGRFIYWADFETGQRQTFDVLSSAGTEITTVGFADETQVLLGTGRGDLLIYDLASPTREADELERLNSPGQMTAVTSFVLGEDAQISVAYDNNRLAIWDLEHGALLDVLASDELSVAEAVVDDAGAVLVRYDTGELARWLPDGSVEPLLMETEMTVGALLPDGEHALAVAADGELVRLRLADGDVVQTYETAVDLPGTVFSRAGGVALSSEPIAAEAAATEEALGGPVPAARVTWNVTGDSVLATLDAPTTNLATDPDQITFSPDGSQLAIVGDRTRILVFDVNSGAEVESFEREREISALAYKPDGALIIGYADGGVAVQREDGSGWRDLRAHDRVVRSIAISPNDRFALTMAADGRMLLWSLAEGESVRAYPGVASEGEGVLFAPNGQSFAAYTADGTLSRWRVDTDENLITWARSNRLVRPLSAADCRAFEIPGDCPN